MRTRTATGASSKTRFADSLHSSWSPGAERTEMMEIGIGDRGSNCNDSAHMTIPRVHAHSRPSSPVAAPTGARVSPELQEPEGALRPPIVIALVGIDIE